MFYINNPICSKYVIGNKAAEETSMGVGGAIHLTHGEGTDGCPWWSNISWFFELVKVG